MSHNSFASQLLDPGLFGTLIGTRRHIWQMNFLNADELARFSEKRGLAFFEKADIIQLWQLGFLRADLIQSNQAFQRPGIIERGIDSDGEYIYTDERSLPVHPTDWESEIAKLETLPPDAELLFHPFRYYVLFEFERRLSRFRIRKNPKFPIKHFVVPDFASFKQWSYSGQFIPQIEIWNNITSLVVLIEPCMYSQIFHSLSLNMSMEHEGGWETLYRLINEHWKDVTQCYHVVGIERLKEIHRELCYATNTLDPNETVHTLLCLGRGDSRLKLEGHLGGAIFLRTMAEMLRRATEDTFSILLQEEDECGFGWTPGNGRYKKQLYGSDRLLDGDRHIANDFLRHLGLNYGFRLQWYVEGKTEWHALHTYFQDIGATHIDVVDLHGEVAQRGQRGIAFRESLRADMRLEVFSIVSIDGDVSENVRVVRKAAEDDDICGKFFISTPDFEFANFELPELEEVLWEMAVEQGADPDEREQLHRAIQGSKKAGELLRRAKQALPQSLGHIAKNAPWAEYLIAYALKNPVKQQRRLIRPIIEAIKWAEFITQTPNVENYKTVRRNYRVDKNTGELVPRSS